MDNSIVISDMEHKQLFYNFSAKLEKLPRAKPFFEVFISLEPKVVQ
jgi:hypothetical protein